MNIRDGIPYDIPDDILRNILGYVGETRCQRIDTKSARQWFPVPEDIVETVREKRTLGALKNRLCRRRTQPVKEYEAILESSDPWEAREDWERRYAVWEKDYTSFVVRRRRRNIKKMNVIQEDYEEYFLGLG